MRIVHLGIGAFHRAHQAVYTDEAVAAGDHDWRITGVSLLSSTVRDALAPQDWWYTVTERSNGESGTRAVSALDRIIVAPENPEAVIEALAAPETHLVTLTVTEKGYHRATGRASLDMADPDIRAELAGGGPRTIFGYLAAGLARRRKTGAGGLTLISCDNLSDNGRLLGGLLTEFVEVADPGLLDWLRDNVACPDTMVDRIVPATTPEHRTAVAAALGMEDAGAIITEPFRQWVIENRFAGLRPKWEAVGVQIVADVRPFERAKLRLLNAAHSTLAHAGLMLGYRFVHEAVADADLRAFVFGLLDEAVPTLMPAEGLDPRRYIEAIMSRFANADLRHDLRQIATDASQKLPQRWFATMIDRKMNGLNSPFLLAATAIWLDCAGQPGSAPDPLANRLANMRRAAGDDATALVDAFVSTLDPFPPALRERHDVSDAIVAALQSWRQDQRALLRLNPATHCG